MSSSEEYWFVVATFFASALIGLLLAFPIMWCWNYALVYVFDLPEITWGKAWCINFLAHAFFKSIVVKKDN